MRFLGWTIAVRLLIPLHRVTAFSQEILLSPEVEISAVPLENWTNYWKFNYSSSAPHYFASLYGLLQQWPNTFFPNGHSIVPCEIPPFTKLYHGRTDGDPPPSPEWVAFDIDMSYAIMGGTRNSHMLTYQTTKTAKCVYFDGESATLFGSGQLDTQMLHIFGNVTGPPRNPDNAFRGLWQEYARAIGLCDWLQEKKLGGLGWGFEGIVRMNAGFEMIWCNFSSPSIRLVSHLNVTAPLLSPTEEGEASREFNAMPTSYYPLPPSPTRSDKATDPSNPPAPPNWRTDWGREPFFRSQSWNWFASSTAHYGSTAAGPGLGETRVRILSCGFLSYYSPKFTSESIARAQIEQKSLNLTKVGLWMGAGEHATRLSGLTSLTRRRRAHTLGDVSKSDAKIMKTDTEKVLVELLRGPISCSGMDWMVTTNEIVQTYAGILTGFLKSLQGFHTLSKGNKTSLKDWMVEIRDQSHTFLLPFMEYPNASSVEYGRNSKLFNETFSRCRFHHTRLLDPDEGIALGPEESTTKWAIEETTGGICNALVDIGLSIEGLWQSTFKIPVNASSLSGMEVEAQRWTEGVEELMAWLGWAGEWTSCKEKCEWNEKCFIPMWPLLTRGSFGRRPRRGNRPGYGGYGYGRPDYPYGPGYRQPPYFNPPGNGTGRPKFGPPGGYEMWRPDESDLWEPRCVKPDIFTVG